MTPRLKKYLMILLLILILALLIYTVVHSQHYFSRRSIRLFQRGIRSFGVFSPLSVLVLILLSTLIPPLPLPIPLIEMATGLVFGFAQGAVLIWLSQLISSVIAFKAARFLNEKFFAKSLGTKWVKIYREYIHRSGPWAVGIIRATMGAPFNIVSYLAGLTHMGLGEFLIATSIGVIPESLLFAFVGSELRILSFSLWYLFAGLALLGVVGFLSSFTVIKILNSKRNLS